MGTPQPWNNNLENVSTYNLAIFLYHIVATYTLFSWLDSFAVNEFVWYLLHDKNMLCDFQLLLVPVMKIAYCEDL